MSGLRSAVAVDASWQVHPVVGQVPDCRSDGCPHCGGDLHSATYPRKPHGLAPGRVMSRLSRCRSGRPPSSLPSAPLGAQSAPLPTDPPGAAPPSRRREPASGERHRGHRRFLSTCIRIAAGELRLAHAATLDAHSRRGAAFRPFRPFSTRIFRNAAVARRRRVRSWPRSACVCRPDDRPAHRRQRLRADGERRRVADPVGSRDDGGEFHAQQPILHRGTSQVRPREV